MAGLTDETGLAELLDVPLTLGEVEVSGEGPVGFSTELIELTAAGTSATVLKGL